MRPGRPFIQSIVSKSTDKTREIIVDLAKAAAFAGRFQAAFAAENARLLAEIPLDPADPKNVDSARDTINEAMYLFAKEQRRHCVQARPTEANAKAACSHFASLLGKHEAHVRANPDGEPLFALTVGAPQAVKPGPSPDCSVGLCYRGKVPYLITYSVAGIVDTKLVELPNGAELVAIDISRAFLVKRFQEFDFDENGFITRAKIEKDSELLAAAKLPIDVLTAISEGLQLRIKFTEENTKLAKSEADLIRRRAKLKKDQQDRLEQQVKAAAAKQKTSSSPPGLFASPEPPGPSPSPAPTPQPELDPILKGGNK